MKTKSDQREGLCVCAILPVWASVPHEDISVAVWSGGRVSHSFTELLAGGASVEHFQGEIIGLCFQQLSVGDLHGSWGDVLHTSDVNVCLHVLVVGENTILTISFHLLSHLGK